MLTAVSGEAATIDFTSNDQYIHGPSSYSEDGFAFTALSGDAFAVYYHELAVGYGNPVGIGDTLSMVANSGGLFTFDSVGYRGWGGTFRMGSTSTVWWMVAGQRACPSILQVRSMLPSLDSVLGLTSFKLSAPLKVTENYCWTILS